ncbi:MAG: hypothetical protein ABSE76_00525 [Minisyncoccia bacterium]
MQLYLVGNGKFVQSSNTLVKNATRKPVHFIETNGQLLFFDGFFNECEQFVELIAFGLVGALIEAERRSYVEVLALAVVFYAFALSRKRVARILLFFGRYS